MKTTSQISNPSQMLDQSTTTNCYLPLENGKWLAYEQPVKPVSADVNLCDALTDIGVQNVTVQ